MKMSLVKTKDGKLILLSTNENLDLTSFEVLDDVATVASINKNVNAIVVDLKKTIRVFDSGKAMLIALHHRAGHLKNKIFLTNVSNEIQRELSQNKFSEYFHINDTPLRVYH